MNRITQARFAPLAAALTLLLVISFNVSAQTTSFTYQGRLTNGGSPATGAYDLQFALFDALAGGTQVGSTVSTPNVTVNNGIFTVTLDFGAAAFPGANRWLEISARLAGSGSFITLTPRQPVTSTPYATKSLNALTAMAADALSPTCVGCVTDAQIAGVSGSKVNGAVANATNAVNATNATNATHATNADNATNATNAANFTGPLAGDVTGGQTTTTVAKLQNRSVANTAPTEGQVLKFNATANRWEPGTDNVGTGGGGVTSVTASAPLASSGGTTPNISLPNPLPIANGGTGSATQNFVDLTSAQTIGGTKTFSNTIAGNISGNAANFTGSLAGDVTGPQTNTQLANGSVTTAKIADGNITNAKITDVAGSKITGSITTATIPAANVTGILPIANGGTGSATQNFVDLTNAQTIGGTKTFSNTIAGSISGNAATATTATNASQLGGIAANQYVQTTDARLSDQRSPLPGSSNYIQNGTSQQAANFNISGNGTIGGNASIGGNVGIGTNVPGAALQVSSNGGLIFPQLILNRTGNPSDGSWLTFQGEGNGFWTLAAFADQLTFKSRFSGDVDIMDLRRTGPNTITTSTGARLTSGGVWTNNSDRNLKHRFSAVNPREILQKVVKLPIQSWSYKVEDEGIRHLGPMAQDFAAAFQLGGSDKSIGTIDADGVALVAIQGLHQLVEEKTAQTEQLQQQVQSLKEQNQQLQRQVQQLLETELRQQQREIESLKKLICLTHPKADACKPGKGGNK